MRIDRERYDERAAISHAKENARLTAQDEPRFCGWANSCYRPSQRVDIGHLERFGLFLFSRREAHFVQQAAGNQHVSRSMIGKSCVRCQSA